MIHVRCLQLYPLMTDITHLAEKRMTSSMMFENKAHVVLIDTWLIDWGLESCTSRVIRGGRHANATQFAYST
jgi:hypothetical protein